MKMKEFLVAIAANILSSVVWLTITFVLYIPNVDSSNISSFINTNDNYRILSYSIATGLFLVVVCNVMFIFWLNRNKFRSYYPLLEFDYKNISFVYELKFLNRYEVINTREHNIMALKRITGIEFRNIWTGSRAENPTLIYNPHKHEISKIDSGEIGKSYKISFSKPFYSKEKTSFTVTSKCEDKLKKMHPHLAFRVMHPTDRLTLRVIAPKQILEVVKCGEYADDTTRIELRKVDYVKSKDDGSISIYEFSVRNPILFHNYRIDWRFTD